MEFLLYLRRTGRYFTYILQIPKTSLPDRPSYPYFSDEQGAVMRI